MSFREPDEDLDHQRQIAKRVECPVLMVDDGPKIPVTVTGEVVHAFFDL